MTRRYEALRLACGGASRLAQRIQPGVGRQATVAPPESPELCAIAAGRAGTGRLLQRDRRQAVAAAPASMSGWRSQDARSASVKLLPTPQIFFKKNQSISSRSVSKRYSFSIRWSQCWKEPVIALFYSAISFLEDLPLNYTAFVRYIR